MTASTPPVDRILVLTPALSGAAAAVGLLALVAGRPLHTVEVIALAAGVAVAPVVAALSRWAPGRTEAAPLALAVAVAGIATGTWVSGGLASPWLVWWLVLPLSAGFVAGARPAVAVGLAAGLVLAGIGLAPLFGAHPLPAPEAAAARLVHIIPAGGVALALAWRWELHARQREAVERRASRALRALAENVQAGALLVEDGVVTWANPEGRRVLDRDPTGRALADAVPGIDPTRAVDLDDSVADLELPPQEVVLPRSDGRAATAEIRLASVHIGPRQALLVTILDQTAQRAAEAARLAALERLQEARRLELLGQVAGGMAHDFNNLLVGLVTNSELLLESPDLTAEDRELAAETREASERAAALVRKLQAWAGAGARAPRSVRVGDVTDEVARLVRPASARDGVAITVVHGPDLPPVTADPADLRLVVTNLVQNAVEASAAAGHGGRVVVRTRQVTADVDRLGASLVGHGAPGRYIEVEVRDDGLGIDPRIRPRVLEPFFSTRAGNHGLGLPAVETVVRRLGGALFLDPGPTCGTAARVLLPPALERPAAPAPARAPTPLDLRGRPVLVVDDEPHVRRLLARLLGAWGADVHLAEDVASARARLADPPAPWAIVLTDFVMPDGSGLDVARQARAADPDVPVLLCSGFIAHPGDATDAFEAVLHKPFAPDELLRAVQAAGPRVDLASGGDAVG